YGGGIGAVEHHSESPEAQFVMTAGLTVVTPSNPHDAFWMMRQAIASADPVVFLEPKQRYWETGEVGDAADLDLHRSRVVHAGDDVTVMAYGPTVRTCLDAAAECDESLDVIDLRS